MSNRLLIDIKNVAKLQHFKDENKRFNILRRQGAVKSEERRVKSVAKRMSLGMW